MDWGTKGPGTLGICNFFCMPNDKQANSILPSAKFGHRSPEYSNSYGLGDPGSKDLWDMQVFLKFQTVNKLNSPM